MESVFLTIKFVLLVAMEFFVIGVLGIALILGVYQVVRDKVRESRLLDQVASQTHPATKQAH
jgi:hypothetical protein